MRSSGGAALLPHDKTGTGARPRSVCLVANDLDLTGARRLLEQGAAVHVLYCGPGRAAAIAESARRFREQGMTFSTPESGGAAASLRVRNVVDSCHADRSDAIRYGLARLHTGRRFDVIEFPAANGLGFRTVQAKRAGLGFGDVCLTVRLDSCNAWDRDQECRWPSGPEELELDFAERYAFEQADVQAIPDPAMRDYVRRIGWAERDAAPPTDPDAGDACPLVTAAVPHYNLGRYLPEALASLAGQTYPNLEVVVIDDGSTDQSSLDVFGQMRSLYPQFRFVRQSNAGIGATRNRGLREANGEYFIPADADNVARPDMVERFVAGIRRNPGLGAMTCYFLAFKDGVSPTTGPYHYAHRPTGGPHALACIRNVYGDGNAIFRTSAFRAVGGYEIDRDTSFEDWEAFVKLVHAGHGVGVIPDHLFYYRHRETGFSRVTDDYRNRQRVLRQFMQLDRLPPAERAVLWNALFGFHRRADRLRELMRYRAADRLHALWRGHRWRCAASSGSCGWDCTHGSLLTGMPAALLPTPG